MQWIVFSIICQTLFQDLKPYNQEEVKFGFIFSNVGFCLVFWVQSIVRRNERHLVMQRILVLSVTGTCFCQTEILYHQKFVECILPYQRLNQQPPPPAQIVA